MIAVRYIEFKQVEGVGSSHRHVFTHWVLADAHVRAAAIDAPSDGSYYKCDVLVTWVDGTSWKFQFDLTSATASLSNDLRLELIFFAGRCLPDDPDEHPTFIRSLDEHYPGARVRASRLLDGGYDVGSSS